jgi:cystathionine beta-lyase
MAPDSLFSAMQDWTLQRYQWQTHSKHMLLCPGVVPSLRAVIEAVTEVGDKVVVQPPVYFPFFEVVDESQRELLLNPLRLENGSYRFDLEHLEQCAQQGAKLLLLCSPHNPVGRVWQREELTSILDIARRYQMIVLSDEIHADLIYSGQQHIPIASLAQDVKVITALSASKTFNIPGLGLSALIIEDTALRKAVQQVFNHWHVSATNPFSMVAFETAYREGLPWLNDLMPYLADTAAMVTQKFATEAPQIKLIEPEGTYLLWLDCREMGLDDAELKDFFVNQAKVGLSPGRLFGEAGSGFMRMNIAAPRSLIEQSVQRIIDALSA